MNVDLGYGRRIEGYRPGMGAHEMVTLVSPKRRIEISLGGVLAQLPGLELPKEDGDDGGN